MEGLRIGDPFDEKTDVGPLATAGAVESLQADVQKSVDAGARVLTGGKPTGRAGQFLSADGVNQCLQRFARRAAENFSARWLPCFA